MASPVRDMRPPLACSPRTFQLRPGPLISVFVHLFFKGPSIRSTFVEASPWNKYFMFENWRADFSHPGERYRHASRIWRQIPFRDGPAYLEEGLAEDPVGILLRRKTAQKTGRSKDNELRRTMYQLTLQQTVLQFIYLTSGSFIRSTLQNSSMWQCLWFVFFFFVVCLALFFFVGKNLSISNSSVRWHFVNVPQPHLFQPSLLSPPLRHKIS